MRTRVRVLYLAVYPSQNAGTRLRGYALGPHAAAAGIDFEVRTFVAPDDYDAWFEAGLLRRAVLVVRGLARVVLGLRAIAAADAVIVLREVAPLGPPVAEWLAARTGVLIWDVDDAVWTNYPSLLASRVPRQLRAPGQKYARIARAADEIWSGSEAIAAWCRRQNSAVHLVPTVVDVPDRLPSREHRRVAGWVGSPSTSGWLDGILPAVAPVCDEVVVVGHPDHAPWSPGAEADALGAIAVGLYPVDTGHPLAEGRSGLKAILYMAVGIPAVMSSTTTNRALAADGVEALFASDPAGFARSVAALFEDEPRWRAMSRAAWERARRDYDMRTWGPKLTARVAALVSSRSAR